VLRAGSIPTVNSNPPREPRSTAVAILAAAMLALALALAAPVLAGDALPAVSTLDVTLGVFFDREGTMCSGTIRPGQPGTIYILAKSAPGTEIISGAEFRFAGLPASWTVFPVPNPRCLSLGNPFGAGVNIAATNLDGTACSPAWSTYLMYTVLVIAGEDEDDVRFELVNREPPTNPAFRCPLVTDCTYAFEAHCVETSPCFVNTTAPAPCAVTPTAVEQATWTKVRTLFR